MIFKFYILNKDYVDMLRSIDYRIPELKTDQSDFAGRIFIGILINTADPNIGYLIPLSSSVKKDINTGKIIYSSTDVVLPDLWSNNDDDTLGKLKFNNSIPILKKHIPTLTTTTITFNTSDPVKISKHWKFLRKQIRVINHHQDTQKLIAIKAQKYILHYKDNLKSQHLSVDLQFLINKVVKPDLYWTKDTNETKKQLTNIKQEFDQKHQAEEKEYYQWLNSKKANNSKNNSKNNNRGRS